jgi:hypothetical protein
MDALINTLTRFWDFIDKRDIDQHAFAWLVAICGWELTKWGMGFADTHPAMSGAEMAMVLGAVGGPYAIFAGVIAKTYFARLDVK